ncbi:MAG: HAMP domain-containing protein [Prevotella sp.]|nr:HAMP domain-containing protein [Prevotella sp.]
MNPVAYIRRKLSVRLSLWIVLFVALLFLAAAFVMFYFARKSIMHEALAKAEKTLDAAVFNIDNMLQVAEVATDNMLWNVEHHLDSPEKMDVYCQKLLKNNPTIEGAAIAFTPGFIKGRDDFMVYYYRDNDSLVFSDHFGTTHYTTQEWFALPIKKNHPIWTDPAINHDVHHPVTSYSVPIHDATGEAVGVLAVDISLNWLSHTIENLRPFPNTNCAMMSQSGAFIIHPDSTMLAPGALFRQLKENPDENLKKLSEAMLAGSSGRMNFKFYGTPVYVFYKPFKYTGWSIDIVCPEYEIFASYHRLQFYMIVIAVVGLVLLLTFCVTFIKKQFKPLEKLDESVQHLAGGYFEEHIPNSRRLDEIGHLQRTFQKMQRSLVSHIEELSQRNATLNERNEALQVAYEQAQEADRVKAAFLQNMTEQMAPPANAISTLVASIPKDHEQLEPQEMSDMTDKMNNHSKRLAFLLDHILELSEKKADKSPLSDPQSPSSL